MIDISEIFLTVQGEGALIGRPTVFVRTGGCDYRCAWCDTMYAVDQAYKVDWREMDAQMILDEVRALSPDPILITLSGGNPALHDFDALLDLGHTAGYTFCMETQGSVLRHWMKKVDFLTLSPKPPSSGMTTNWKRLDRCVLSNHAVFLKVVVFDDVDYGYAHQVAARYPTTPMFLQVGNDSVGKHFDITSSLTKYLWLVQKVLDEHWNTVTVLPQMHLFLWGNTRGR